jgi:CRP/FNR family transcriptional regulator, cyclic AMP receptor protein
MEPLEQTIRTSGAFVGLNPRWISDIVGCAHDEFLAAGAHLFREGAPAERCFLLRDGAVALEVATPGRGAVVIETLHAGEVVGWSWLFPPHRWQFDGRAVEPTRAIALDGACLRAKCDADHELGYELMRRFAAVAVERLQATRLQLLDVYANPVPS